MNFLVVLGLAFALAMDALAVSIGIGVSLARTSFRQALRLGLSFGAFQFLMPVVGWGAGRPLSGSSNALTTGLLLRFYSAWAEE